LHLSLIKSLPLLHQKTIASINHLYRVIPFNFPSTIPSNQAAQPNFA
jgi:hypothetical protein